MTILTTSSLDVSESKSLAEAYFSNRCSGVQYQGPGGIALAATNVGKGSAGGVRVNPFIVYLVLIEMTILVKVTKVTDKYTYINNFILFA